MNVRMRVIKDHADAISDMVKQWEAGLCSEDAVRQVALVYADYITSMAVLSEAEIAERRGR